MPGLVFKDSNGLNSQQDEAKLCFQSKFCLLLDLHQKGLRGNTGTLVFVPAYVYGSFINLLMK